MELNLKERTVLIRGPFTSTVQSLMMGLTQIGANCVLLDTDNASSVRFCNQINDAREANPKNGRATSIKNPLKTDADIRDAIGSAAQCFGSIDLFIDAQVGNSPNRFQLGEALSYLDEEMQSGLRTTIQLTHGILSYLKSRRRGRIVFLMNENEADPVVAATRGALEGFAKTLSKLFVQDNITINLLSLGLTEEWVLSQNSGMTIKDAVEKMKQKDSSLRITEPEKITNTVVFLLSQAGAAITGQYLKLS